MRYTLRPTRRIKAPERRRCQPRHYAELLVEFERTTLLKALGDCGGKVTNTAKMLGMSRAGLYRKLASLGIKSRT